MLKLPYTDNPEPFNEEQLKAISLPSDVKRFAKDIVDGIFYEKVGAEYNKRSRRKPLNRDDIKSKLFGAFYCERRDEGLIKKILDRLYPSAMHILDQLKETDSKRPSRCMQRQEAHTMLGMIVKRLLNDYPHIPVLTIHDSILTTPDHVETVKAVMQDTFREIGLIPKLATTDYGA